MFNFRNLVVVLVLSLCSMLALAGELININTADESILKTELVGIGAQKAKAIVKYRQDNGPFKSVGELAFVKGIADKTIEKNRDKLIVEELEE